jgi:predicted O-methyltransferase YrrM
MNRWLEVPGWFEPDEGKKLQELAKDKICVEVGSFKGRSASCMGAVAKEVHCVDYFRTNVGNGQSQEDHYTVLDEFNKNTKGYVIRIHIGSSLHACEEFSPESVDLVFIDALHTYKGVICDIFCWWDILKMGGVFCFHDYGFGFHGVTEAVNKVFGAVDEIPIGSFAWVAKRREDFWKFSVWEGK